MVISLTSSDISEIIS